MARLALGLLPILCLAQEPGPYHVEAVTSKHKSIEGPVWSAKDGYLLFADVPMETIQRIDTKGLSMFRERSGGASGNAFDDKGRLYTCEAHARRVTRTDRKGTVDVLVDQCEGKKLNAPNDIAVSKHDDGYFTDPAFGSAVEKCELSFYGVFHISPKGQVEASLRLQTRPNGVAASPDGGTLYVTNSDERNVRAYDITKEGTLQNERVFVAKTAGVPGGIKVDEKGNVYVAAAEVLIFSPKGEPLGTLKIAEKPSNIVFGDGDLKSLYVTARTTLYRVRLEAFKGVAIY
jgi:sugar lactone lactonase YvrE